MRGVIAQIDVVLCGQIDDPHLMYFAHSTDDLSQSNWQPLAEHLRDVAALAEQFGAELGLAKAARLAGLLHDLGKYSPRFQARLNGGRGWKLAGKRPGRNVACCGRPAPRRLVRLQAGPAVHPGPRPPIAGDLRRARRAPQGGSPAVSAAPAGRFNCTRRCPQRR